MKHLSLEEIRRKSSRNRRFLEKSNICGCYFCLEMFPPSRIEWCIDGGDTALCPHCDIDAVLGSACGIKITKGLLFRMHKKHFGLIKTLSPSVRGNKQSVHKARKV